jgi:hemolysin III
MAEVLPGHKRSQSVGEEFANSVSHGIGLVAALVAIPFLLLAAARRGDAWAIVGDAVFGGSVVFLYLTSTLYHAWAKNKVKRIFQVIDHCAIYLLIAGTYTPFTLGVLRGSWGWTLFGMVWGLAILGVFFKSLRGMKHPRLSMALYLGMGWLALIAIRPLWLHIPLPGFLLIAAGGLAYTSGVAFYAAEHRRYSHFVWHLFVVIGTCFHFFAVLWYAG